jgi:hypothetical protein
MSLWLARDPGGRPAGEHCRMGKRITTLPALLKGFFEQTFRYGYALDVGNRRGMVRKLYRERWLGEIHELGRRAK